MITTFDLYSKTTFSKTTFDFLYPIKVSEVSYTFCFRANCFLKRKYLKDGLEKTIHKIYNNIIDTKTIQIANQKQQDQNNKPFVDIKESRVLKIYKSKGFPILTFVDGGD